MNLKKILDQNKQTQSFKQLLMERQRLPVYGYRTELLDVFRQENVFIVAGETGSGKSTQVPQFILEVRCRIYVMFFVIKWHCDDVIDVIFTYVTHHLLMTWLSWQTDRANYINKLVMKPVNGQLHVPQYGLFSRFRRNA